MRHLRSVLKPFGFLIPGVLFLGMLHPSSRLLSPQYSRADCPSCKTWNQPQEPFKIYGNTYYVGTHGLSSILITSSAGLLVIDGALPESAEQIRDNIHALGFRIEDVKLIVNSHVHFDHAGGIAALQHWSHARVAASEWSAEVLRKGGVAKDDPQYGLLPEVAKVGQVERIEDEEVFRVGDVAITAHLTPGHTPGGTSWTWKSCQQEPCLNLVYADSLTAVSAPDFKFTSHPGALRGFEKSFAFLENTPCDILITAHPDASGLWSRLERRNQGVKPDPMIDRIACGNLANTGREQLRKRVQSETRH
jgi:metallo-beta-lactamase class B